MKSVFYKKIKLVITVVTCLMFISSSGFLGGAFSNDKDDNVFLAPLEPGWNLISLRYDAVIVKENLTIKQGVNEYTWDQAVANSLVSNFVFKWDAVNQFYTFADDANPSYGYWIYAYQGTDVWGDANATVVGIDGGGTAGYISKFTDVTTLGNSVVYESQSENIGIGDVPPDNAKLYIKTNMSEFKHGIYSESFKGIKSINTALAGTGITGEGGHAGVTGYGGYIGIIGQGFYGGWFEGQGYFSGNVGIGTTSPTAKLHVNLSELNAPAGNIGHQNIATGDCAIAMGRGTSAIGNYSFAMGQFTTASGYASTAMGYDTTASGTASTAMGSWTTANGYISTAMGDSTTASGWWSTAMGYETTASGQQSTAMGIVTNASGEGSTAMGVSTTASGSASTAMGYGTNASGLVSTAMGSTIIASGQYSVGIGLSDNPSKWDVTNPNVMSIMGGKVGINTTSPDEELDIVGDARISGDYKYSVLKTCYLNIPPTAFQRSYTNDDDQYLVHSQGFGYLNGGLGTLDIDLYSPIYLPNGATVTNFTIYYLDNNATENISFFGKLYRRSNTDISSTDMTEIPTTSTSGWTSTIQSISNNTISDATIDNENAQYFVRVYWNADALSSLLRFYGCRIEYTIDTLNP